MRTAARNIFTTIRTEGALLPADFLQHVAEGNREIEGLSPDSYHLVPGEKLNEAINRSWNRLLGAWTGFKDASEKLGASDLGTGLTRERWLLPLFQELGYGRLQTAKAFEIDGKSYPISHGWQGTPIHLVGCKIDLDRRTSGVVGAARTSPHGLVQEMLNRSEAHLWGFVSNGHRLRILRDNITLTRQAFVDFDLVAMFDGEVYADFVVLWLLCHQSRVEGERPELCWLEKWSQLAEKRGTRVLEYLRTGVENAINALGSGFLAHPANRELRNKLSSAKLNSQDYYRQLLRVVYRILFLFVAEDRGLLFEPKSSIAARELYGRFYSVARLRRLAERRAGTQHPDLWRGLTLVFEKLDTGCEELALPALGSFLWSREATTEIAVCELANRDLLKAINSLAFTVDGRVRRMVDYKNLGSEELGSIYEALLELHPQLNVDASTFGLSTAAGNERKTTGSYYTPTSLVNCLLDSALDPVLDDACKKPNPEQAILALKICDPATGSGHFLIAAAHRLAKRLAAVLTGDDEPSPEATRTALRNVIGRCLYGVDVNPMAVELCKVSLWMEALEPGKPLSFLDHRIKVGNSLMGATPVGISLGIPDEAFSVLTGDEKTVVSALKKRNKRERTDIEQGQQSLFGEIFWIGWAEVRKGAEKIIAINDDEIGHIYQKQAEYHRLLLSDSYRNQKLVADAWCAAFVLSRIMGAPAITALTFEEIKNNPDACPADLQEKIARLTTEYRFFHWHIEFPEIYSLPKGGENAENRLYGWNGGFDTTLGNPPWDRVKLQEKEWFSGCVPEIANAPNASKRKQMIEALKQEQPFLFEQFQQALRHSDGESHFLRDSDLYPLCGRGDINLYAIFAEANRGHLATDGRVGLVIPTNIATDDTTKLFFRDVVDKRSLVSLLGFENEERVFPSVHHATKFCLLTLAGEGKGPASADFIFYARQAMALKDEHRRFFLNARDFHLLNPNTRTCPIFRSHKDAELTKLIYRRVPILIKEGPPQENKWDIRLDRMFDMANDSHFFRSQSQLEDDGWVLEGNVFTRGAERYVPLFEAKMIHHYNHRYSTYHGASLAQRNVGSLPTASVYQLQDPYFVAMPSDWLPAAEMEDRLGPSWQRNWLLGWRDITNATNERTLISAIIPLSAVGDTYLLIFPENQSPKTTTCLVACLNSFIVDYSSRQKLGGLHLKYHVFKQLPVVGPGTFRDAYPILSEKSPWEVWIASRVLELTYTAWGLEKFANNCGYNGPPFLWDGERRFLLRSELDAAFFHLYLGTPKDWQKEPESLTSLFPTARSAVEYIMETFPIVKKNDVKAHRRYRTKDTILEIYDEMAEADRTGVPYRTRLDPPPADPSVAHSAENLPVSGVS